MDVDAAQSVQGRLSHQPPQRVSHDAALPAPSIFGAVRWPRYEHDDGTTVHLHGPVASPISDEQSLREGAGGRIGAAAARSGTAPAPANRTRASARVHASGNIGGN